MGTASTEYGKGYKPRRKKRFSFGFVILAVIILMTLISGIISYNYVMDSQRSVDSQPININEEDGIKLEIPLGSNTTKIASILEENGIIKHPKLFRLLSRINGYDGTYKSGTHIIDKNAKYDSLKGYEMLMRILASKPIDNPSVKVMIPEGLTFNQIADRLLEKKLISSKEAFENAADNGNFDYKFIKGIPKRQYKLQGYLFPDTYIFDSKGGEKEIIKKLLGQFDEVFLPEYYKRVEELGMSVDEVITMASIIEREAKVPEERETIAGVFYNRLKSKDKTLQKLQSCATLQYILLERDGKVKENLTLEDEQIDNPYNTYMYGGLPPGPICSPGRDSIIAALNPEQHDYYYFVTKEDGTGGHYFSKTYNEHLNAKARADRNKKK